MKAHMRSRKRNEELVGNNFLGKCEIKIKHDINITCNHVISPGSGQHEMRPNLATLMIYLHVKFTIVLCNSIRTSIKSSNIHHLKESISDGIELYDKGKLHYN